MNTQERSYEGCTAVVFPKLIAVSLLNRRTLKVFSSSPSNPPQKVIRVQEAGIFTARKQQLVIRAGSSVKCQGM